ncbi:MAG: hypothetical protein M3153_03795 [Chloroflexota bacterium]|nr:hypothetical protein [Chloroflexota bacterium]
MYSEPLIRSTTRLSRRSSGDLRAIRRATTRIEELSAALDRQLVREARPEEQLRLLRQTTSQITRTANDAIQAYRRVTEGLRVESERDDTDPSEAARLSEALSEARTEMLHALEVASQRYPWAKPWRPEDG